MNNKGVVVDASRGGSDQGATGNGLVEKEVTLEVSNYMVKRFMELGIPVASTRDKDVTLSNEERVETIINAFGKEDQVVVISNQLSDGQGEGAEVIYALRDTDQLAKNIFDEIENEGQVMRKYYQRRLPEDLSKDYSFIIRETAPLNTVVVDYGFVDNKDDAMRLDEEILDYAEGVVRAVSRFLGYTYTSPEGVIDTTYMVKIGDSLYSIAVQYGVTVEDLKEANNLENNALTIGEVLIIPRNENVASSDLTYTVQSGDNLYEIAKRFGVTVNDLISANNLTSTALSLGQVLKIPKSAKEEMLYTVKKGDSLWTIANQFDTTIAALKKANQLDSSALSIGQELIIPN